MRFQGVFCFRIIFLYFIILNCLQHIVFYLGGIPGKLKGRVSDASLVGCGAYANKSGAAATNGPGESIMKMTLAREAVYNMEQGQNAQVSF